MQKKSLHISLFLFPPVQGALNTHQHTGGFVFSPADGKSNEGDHEGILLVNAIWVW